MYSNPASKYQIPSAHYINDIAYVFSKHLA